VDNARSTDGHHRQHHSTPTVATVVATVVVALVGVTTLQLEGGGELIVVTAYLRPTRVAPYGGIRG
jgi:hypothetical protein